MFSAGKYRRVAAPDTIACDICGIRVPTEEYANYRSTREHLDLRAKWETLRAETEDLAWIREELRSLSPSSDVLRPKFVRGASEITVTQDRGIQGPTYCCGDEWDKRGRNRGLNRRDLIHDQGVWFRQG